MVREVTCLFKRGGSGATRKCDARIRAAAIASACQGGFEEWLRRKRIEISGIRGVGVSDRIFLRGDRRPTSKVGGGASQPCLDGCISFGEALPAQSHHVRHRVDVDRLILVSDPPTDVSHFQENPVGQLALDGEVKRIHHVGPEVRV